MRSDRSLLLAAIVSAATAVSFCAPVSVGDEWQPITPEELKMEQNAYADAQHRKSARV